MKQALLTEALADRVDSLDWDCHTADTQYLTHGIHRYSGKFIPQIAGQLIDLLSGPGDLVLDPFCGSGTTLLEASLRNRRALGIDLNPIAVMISKAKCLPLGRIRTTHLQREIEVRLDQIDSTGEYGVQGSLAFGSKRKNDDPRLADEWHRKWFHRRVLEELLGIDAAIKDIADEELQLIARVAFSDILRKSSNANNSYPNVMFDRTVESRPSPLGPFKKRLADLCDAAGALHGLIQGKNWLRPQVSLGDVRAMPIRDGSVDAIVTHPPYMGSVPYAEYQQLSLRWFGHDHNALDRTLLGGRRQARDSVARFELSYREALQECLRVLRPGGHLGLLIGNPVVKRVRVDLVAQTEELCRALGFALAARKSRSGTNRRANKMAEEVLLVFAKPIKKARLMARARCEEGVRP